jgi:hypothetical protein
MSKLSELLLDGPRIWDPKSRIRVLGSEVQAPRSQKKLTPDPGPVVKNTGSQIRIRNTGGKLKICTRLNNNKKSTVRYLK